MRPRALELVERERAVALRLHAADVLRSDIVDRELKPAPQRQALAVPERHHLGVEGRTRREGEEPGAAPVAERPLERERPGLAPEVERDVARGEVVVAGSRPFSSSSATDWPVFESPRPSPFQSGGGTVCSCTNAWPW